MDITQIKQKADEVLSKYNPEGLVPFPFERMATSLADVDLLFSDTMPTKISGAIFFQNGRFKLLINKQKAETKQYFTAAHEFGHYFLHNDWLRLNPNNSFVDYEEMLDFQGMLLRPEEAPTTGEAIQKERDANSFEAELVMPVNKVREFWNLTHDIASCANAFQVSQSAMAIRLENLHLVS